MAGLGARRGYAVFAFRFTGARSVGRQVLLIACLVFAAGLSPHVGLAASVIPSGSATTTCDAPDPDGGQPSSFVGTVIARPGRRHYVRNAISGVSASIAWGSRQGRSSGTGDPVDGAVYVMLASAGSASLVQAGVIDRGAGPHFFTAWGHGTFGVAGSGYCERLFGPADHVSHRFAVRRTPSAMVVAVDGVVWQRIRLADLAWPDPAVYSAQVFAETHGPAGRAKLPRSWVHSIRSSAMGLAWSLESSGPAGAAALAVTRTFSYASRPARVAGFDIPHY